MHGYRFTANVFLIVALLAASPGSRASDASRGNQICAELRLLLPELQSFGPEAARARFVAAMSMKFQDDASELQKVQAEIDRLAIASCRRERDGLLRIMQLVALAEAFEGHW